MNPDLRCGDPATQWQWHESYRDLAKNMYRTSYADASHGREVATKSEYPSGYGGHVASVRHDVLHRNTGFDRTYHLRRTDPARDAHPSFKDQLDGIPTVCKFPRGARKNPTHKATPGDGSTGGAMPPWGVTLAAREPPSHRNLPATMTRAASSPALRGGGMAALGGSLRRENVHAQFAGDDMDQHDAGPGCRAFEKTPHPRNARLGSPAGSRAGEELMEHMGADWEHDSPYGRQ